MLKICSNCKISKDIDSFYKNKNINGGFQHYCKQCCKIQSDNYYRTNNKYIKKYTNNRYNKNKDYAREERLKKNFGITIEEYNLMVKNQDNKCAICGSIPTKKRLAVDHDHKTNKIRGLLCQHCNTALGLFKDNSHLLLNAMKYLYSSHKN